MGAIDLAHAACAQRGLDAIRSELPADDARLSGDVGHRECRGFQKDARLTRVRQERLDLLPQSFVARAQFVHGFGPLGRRAAP